MLSCTFSNVSKIHGPSPLQVQKSNRRTLKQKWSHMTWDILGKTLVWPQIVTRVTSAHNWPLTNFLPIWLVTTACHKIACTVSPNELGQIKLPWASMLLMTSFHYSQFHCSIWMKVSQILWPTFSNVSKNNDPSPLWVQKSNRRNMTLTQKWSRMTQDILGKTLIWSHIVTHVTSACNWPLTNFFPMWLNITKLLIQCPLMSWTKFHYHGHQWHLAPHFMTHIVIVKYEWK